jgi:hypothetical protein
MSLRKIDSVALMLNLNSQMNFDPDIPHFFTDLSEIWYTTSSCIATGKL